MVLLRSPLQNLLRRTKKLRRLDANRCAGRTGLDAGLIIIARAKIAFDCQLLAHLIERRIAVCVSAQHRQLSAFWPAGRATEELTEALPGRAIACHLIHIDDRDGSIRAAFGADSAADAVLRNRDLPVWEPHNASPTA